MQYSTFFKEPLFTGKICTGFFCPYFSDILHTIWEHQEKFQNLVISRFFYRLSKRRATTTTSAVRERYVAYLAASERRANTAVQKNNALNIHVVDVKNDVIGAYKDTTRGVTGCWRKRLI